MVMSAQSVHGKVSHTLFQVHTQICKASGLSGPDMLVQKFPVWHCCVDLIHAFNVGIDAADSSALSFATRPGDKMTGRYYQGTHQEAKAPLQSKSDHRVSDADKEREQLLADLEQKVAAEPHNEELWVLFALQHIDFGAVGSLKGMLTSMSYHMSQHAAEQ